MCSKIPHNRMVHSKIQSCREAHSENIVKNMYCQHEVKHYPRAKILRATVGIQNSSLVMKKEVFIRTTRVKMLEAP
jgi:hypothetical protein